MEYTHRYASPLGGITLASDGTALTGLWFDGQRHFARGLDDTHAEQALPVFEEADHWLDRYFSGGDPGPVPPLRPKGTPFQTAVWEALRSIPRGETATYAQIARTLQKCNGRRTSARAVGGAVGRNPVSLMIPCHRVLGANGTLTGYAGGVERKAWLLALERTTAAREKKR